MKLNHLETVVFDLDMTLLNSLEAITVTLNMVADEHNLKRVKAKDVLPLIGYPLEESMKMLWGSVNERMLESYRKHFKEGEKKRLKLMDGAKEVINFLKDMGLKTAVLTNRKRVKEILSDFNISCYFDGLFGIDDVPVPKPDPLALKFVLEKIGSKADASSYVGDSVVDMKCAKALGGVVAIGISTGGYSASQLKKAGADIVVSNLYELKKLFKNGGIKV